MDGLRAALLTLAVKKENPSDNKSEPHSKRCQHGMVSISHIVSGFTPNQIQPFREPLSNVSREDMACALQHINYETPSFGSPTSPIIQYAVKRLIALSPSAKVPNAVCVGSDVSGCWSWPTGCHMNVCPKEQRGFDRRHMHPLNIHIARMCLRNDWMMMPSPSFSFFPKRKEKKINK